MRATIVYDCEFLTTAGAPDRFWCGPRDPDPTVVQIGAVRLGLEADAPFLDELTLYVQPRDRMGATVALDPHLTALTGITEETLAREATPLAEALRRFAAFAGPARCWSWGKDELNLMAISCYVERVLPPMPAARFGNAAALLVKAGMSPDAVARMRSHTLCAALGVSPPAERAHDALGDARSVAYALQHLLRSGKLMADDFGGHGGPP